MQKVIVIVGPTASGKSGLAVELAKKYNGEVISADSRQVYRGLDIGTGKVTKKEMAGVPHYLLDVANPRKIFTASEFAKLAHKAIEEIVSRGKVPIICGGTGFYIDTLIGNISLPQVEPNPELRKKLEKLSPPELYKKLQRLDPRRAKMLDPRNPVRLIRAIEIATELGAVPVPNKKLNYDALWIGIEWPKEKLHERIHERLLARMKIGMVTEAKRLHEKGLTYRRMHQLGLEYRYLALLLQNKLSKEGFIEELDHAIRSYARAQIQYWRRNKNIIWLPADKLSRATSEVKKWLNA